MKTKTAAIRHARANVSLAPSIGKQWRVDTFSAHPPAWRQGCERDYWSARASYRQALIDSAREYLDLPPVQDSGLGSWTDAV